MGQVLHGCSTTTAAVRRAIQHSQESLRGLAARYGINQKTVAKWKKPNSVADLPTGPKDAKSTVLSVEDEAVIVAFRRHTLLPLDDCLYTLQATIPHLTLSSLHRCLQRHGISRFPPPAFHLLRRRNLRRLRPMSRATSRIRKSSRPTPSATFTSTSPKSKPPKVSSISTSPSIAPASLPSSSLSKKPEGHPRQPSWKL